MYMTFLASPPRKPSADPGWMPLVAVCLGTFMLLVDVSVVNVALPDMAHDLHASLARREWVIDAYALALAARSCSWIRGHSRPLRADHRLRCEFATSRARFAPAASPLIAE
jgi:hypothetical protein